jgi:nitroimidazol reductase NimA-like FMN-containing flavoprotein (pyridoxamine 5'-phosphate oxidase superfamily)
MNGNEESAKAILSQVVYITLATVSPDGRPWNTPVYAAFDEAYHFFWVSAREAQHSQNIRANHRVAIVVYDSMVPPGTGKGVYIQATASELTDEREIARALLALQRRGWESPPPMLEMVETSLSPRRVYQAIPERMWISSVERTNGYAVDARTEIEIFGT